MNLKRHLGLRRFGYDFHGPRSIDILQIQSEGDLHNGFEIPEIDLVSRKHPSHLRQHRREVLQGSMGFRRKHLAALIAEFQRRRGDAGNDAVAADYLAFKALAKFELAVAQYCRGESWLL